VPCQWIGYSFSVGYRCLSPTNSLGRERSAERRWDKPVGRMGFRCPECGQGKHSVFRAKARKTFQCTACRRQTSLIASTLSQGTKLALGIWSLAAHLLGQAKTGLSALALKRQLGASYPAAPQAHAGDGGPRRAVHPARCPVAKQGAAQETRPPLWQRFPWIPKATPCAPS
jgi:hypothetical protein